MINLKILDKESFAGEFERCCRQYSRLKIASAGCGDPAHVLPYAWLGEKLNVTITTSASLNETHPDAISYFINQGVDIKIFKDQTTRFNPRVYLFLKEGKAALFVGSSGFTYSGFFTNVEVNTLYEGVLEKEFKRHIDKVKKELHEWHSDRWAFVPTREWLAGYRRQYKKQRKQEKKKGIDTPHDREEALSFSSWLRHASWPVYHRKVLHGLEMAAHHELGYPEVLNAARMNLPLPWHVNAFDDVENHRLIGGSGKYGLFGQVADSKSFKKFMTDGPVDQKRQAVTAINNIGSLEAPIRFKTLNNHLDVLVSLGPTIKVWSRILAIVRPDLYCSVASPPVRRNLSTALGLPEKSLETPSGYIRLLKLIHASPWHTSPPPESKSGLSLWKRRAALIDAVFW